jgi:hypothetical protein
MELFNQFIQERVYLKGASPKLCHLYQCAFKAFSGATESGHRAENDRNARAAHQPNFHQLLPAAYQESAARACR